MVVVRTDLGNTKESARRERFEPDTFIGGTLTATNVQKAIEVLDTALAASSANITTFLAQQSSLRVTAKAVNFNAANTDTSVPVTLPAGVSRYAIDAVWLNNASASISTATVGVFTASGGGGQTIAANQAITVTASATDANHNAQALTITNGATEAYNDTTLFVRVGTAQGSAATADVIIYLKPLT